MYEKIIEENKNNFTKILLIQKGNAPCSQRLLDAAKKAMMLVQYPDNKFDETSVPWHLRIFHRETHYLAEDFCALIRARPLTFCDTFLSDEDARLHTAANLQDPQSYASPKAEEKDASSKLNGAPIPVKSEPLRKKERKNPFDERQDETTFGLEQQEEPDQFEGVPLRVLRNKQPLSGSGLLAWGRAWSCASCALPPVKRLLHVKKPKRLCCNCVQILAVPYVQTLN
eukprot:g11933.t1